MSAVFTEGTDNHITKDNGQNALSARESLTSEAFTLTSKNARLTQNSSLESNTASNSGRNSTFDHLPILLVDSHHEDGSQSKDNESNDSVSNAAKALLNEKNVFMDKLDAGQKGNVQNILQFFADGKDKSAYPANEGKQNLIGDNQNNSQSSDKTNNVTGDKLPGSDKDHPIASSDDKGDKPGWYKNGDTTYHRADDCKIDRYDNNGDSAFKSSDGKWYETWKNGVTAGPMQEPSMDKNGTVTYKADLHEIDDLFTSLSKIPIAGKGFSIILQAIKKYEGLSFSLGKTSPDDGGIVDNAIPPIVLPRWTSGNGPKPMTPDK